MFRPTRLLSRADKVIEYDAIAATHESVVDPSRTSLANFAVMHAAFSAMTW